jgi:peptide deformylase
MELNLCEADHPLMSTVLEDFDFKNPPVDPVELANSMIELMAAKRGLGLSANQCGLPHRVFVLWSEKPVACFNPRVVDETTETVLLEEGCLSFPHFVVKVKRPKSIKVRFQDAFGNMQTEKYTGMTARAFMHELDHLEGKTFHSRASRIHLDRAASQHKILMRRLKRGEVTIRQPQVVSENQLRESMGQMTINTTGSTFTVAAADET